MVVTGAGTGIGRALARGLAAAGARVVVNDLVFEAATAVAQEIGGYPHPGDVGTEKGVRELVAGAREYLGEIDIYCSNAGIAIGAGPDAPDAAWQQSWEVNLMAHVRASRELLPAGAVGGDRIEMRESVGFGYVPDPPGVVPSSALAARSADPGTRA